MADFTCTVLRTDDYLRILNDEKKITFAVTIGDYEAHQQISILEYDTAEKIEQRMAEIGAQVFEEVTRNKGTNMPIPADIQSLVDSYA